MRLAPQWRLQDIIHLTDFRMKQLKPLKVNETKKSEFLKQEAKVIVIISNILKR